MSLAPGLKSDRLRKQIIYIHRQIYYQKALDEWLEGKCSYEYIHRRGEKLAQIAKRR